jgi:hypothetical protein
MSGTFSGTTLTLSRIVIRDHIFRYGTTLTLFRIGNRISRSLDFKSYAN